MNVIVLASSGTVGATEGLLVVESQRPASCLDACAGEAGNKGWNAKTASLMWRMGGGGTGQSCSSAYCGMKAACFDDCLIAKLLLKGFEVNCLK